VEYWWLAQTLIIYSIKDSPCVRISSHTPCEYMRIPNAFKCPPPKATQLNAYLSRMYPPVDYPFQQPAIKLTREFPSTAPIRSCKGVTLMNTSPEEVKHKQVLLIKTCRLRSRKPAGRVVAIGQCSMVTSRQLEINNYECAGIKMAIYG
jgi:hypothetical protein